MNSEVEVKSTCRRIEVIPGVDDYGHRTYWCANCGRDLEVTTTASGYRHCTIVPFFTARDRFESERSAK